MQEDQYDELVIPKSQAVRIEYPGYAKNLDAVLSTLGDAPGVQQAALHANTQISLKFRPTDMMCRPLLAGKTNTPGLLVECSKNDLQPGKDVTVKVVARVNSSYRFSSLADMQYVADESLKVQEQQLEDHFIAPEPEPLLAVPPIFLKEEDAITYQFRSYYGSDPPALKMQGGNPKLKGQLPAHVVKFVSLQVPQPIQKSGKQFGHANGNMLEDLTKLFSGRPVWSAHDLQERLRSPKGFIGSDVLCNVAYCFRSGPFACLWIRRGYDPRKERQSCRYQLVRYQNPNSIAAQPRPVLALNSGGAVAVQSGADPTPESSVYSELCRFAAMPLHEAALQLCDLQDSHISALVAGNTPSKTCTRAYGWFQQDAWAKVTARVQSRFEALLKGSSGRESSLDPMEQQESVDIGSDLANGAAEEPAAESAEQAMDTAPSAQGGNDIVPEEMLSGLLASWAQSQASGPQTDEEMTEAGGGPQGDNENEDNEFEIFEAESENDNSEGEEAVDEDDIDDDAEEGGYEGNEFMDYSEEEEDEDEEEYEE